MKRRTNPIAIIGAVVAAVAAFFAAQYVGKRMRANEAIEAPKEWNLSKPSHDRVSAAMETGLKPLMAHPKFVAKAAQLSRSGASAAEAEAYGQTLVANGFVRLGEDELAEWNRLRIALTDNSPALCAGLWTGNIKAADLGNALAKLSDADLASWTRLSSQAGIAELDQTGEFYRPTQAQIGALMDNVVGALQGAKRDALQKALQGGTIDDPTACAALRGVLEQVAAMTGEEHVQALRVLAGLNAAE